MAKREKKEKKRKHSQEFYDRLYLAADVAKTCANWAVISVLSFGYWLLVLCIISIFLLNVWFVTMDRLMMYALILAIITAVVYAAILARRKYKEAKIRARLKE